MDEANARIRREAWDFRSRHRGSYLDSNGSLGANPSGPQCVNVPNGFYESIGMSAIRGNAAEWIGFQDLSRMWLDGSFIRHLLVGDVAVFKTAYVGPFGHVDLVLDGTRELYEGLDQNWPLGAPVSEVWHHRELLSGVVRIRGNRR